MKAISMLDKTTAPDERELQPDLNWLAGGGEMGTLIRSMDWSGTPLGPPEQWPQSLRTTVSLCLSSTFPILVCWGEQDIQIYNDAYRPICGDLHPRSMGAPFKEIWASALPVVGEAFDRAHKGEGAYIRDQRMFLDRHGYLEEAFMTFSFSPIRDESGAVGGVFHPITETTAQVLGARRTRGLRELSDALASARTASDIGHQLAAGHAALADDLPFVLFYKHDVEAGQLLLRGRAGIEGDCPLAPAALVLDDPTWPFTRAAVERTAQRAEGLAARFAGSRCGTYEEAADTALVLPVLLPGQQEPYGYLVGGVSPRRALDADYLHFYDQLTAVVSTAVGNVVAYELEQRRAEELAKIDRAKTAFFSNVSHEFRTPLTLILGPLDDALLDAAEPLPPAQRQRIELTQRNALRLLKLVNSLLDFSRIEAGRVQASYAPADLARLTLDLAAVFESAMARGGLAYTVEAQDLGEPVWVDRDMWEKIVFNLLSNAFKFTLDGSVTVRLQRHEDKARLSVSDTGTGIPEQELGRVFERFHRIEGAAGRTYEGTGIGLALMQELVWLHGGTIAVHSVEGEGTRFDIDIPFGHAHLPPERVLAAPLLPGDARMGAAFVEEALRWLPDAEDLQAPAQVAPVAPAGQASGEARPRILVADDNNDMRAYLKSLLAPYADVTLCADGEAAFAMVQRDPPDLLLSDVMMPGLDGFGLIARIRADERLRDVPVMLLSARAGEEAKVEGLQAGADDYMVKPFAAGELLARVRGHVAQARERRRLHYESARRDAYFRALVDASPAMLWTTDANEHCTYLSKRWYDFTGRRVEQDLGRGWLENVHPDDQQRTVEAYLEAAAAREPFAIDFRLRRHDGAYRWVIDTGLPRSDDAGRPDGYVGTVIDIHERRVLQKRFERVAQAGNIGVWYADAPFEQFRMNPEMAAQLGLGRQRQTGVEALLAAVHEADRHHFESRLRRALEQGSTLDIEFRSGSIEAGGMRWLHAVGWCDLDDDGRPLRFDGVTFDVSGHKQAEQELRHLADELAAKNRQQSDFLSTLAHELRNPLAPIRAGIDLMQLDAAGSTLARARDVPGMMQRQVDHMVHLVDDLLDMARLSEGKLILRLETVELGDVVQDGVEMAMPLVSARGHRLALHTPETPVLLQADRHRVAQVISNLVNNAAKYTPAGGAIKVESWTEGAEAVIAVSDSGIGIGPDALLHVFDMYAQGQSSEAMGEGGLGVGLNLVKRLVQLHGGSVVAHSDGEGRGSRFTVRLPLPQAGSEVIVPAPAPAESPAGPVGPLRVLVVDDNVDAAEMLAALLEIGGHRVTLAHDGAGALRAARELAPQVVFLDIGLPDMNGYETAAALRKIAGLEGAMLVALTGWGTADDRARARDAGFDHHLTKPAEFDAVNRLLDAAALQSGREG
ncbi:response regulator [Massilia sp. IC2-477]|uniref:ATP-binding protein n=1 Tax=Massilia sp. IC2-477 TaxID=2887198 RepID=UPI001D11439A|nr:ATP-binding protein [Massilia sp. IC2-477]MCC2956482.1 response regulator [Massilia sp. IC2-477]